MSNKSVIISLVIVVGLLLAATGAIIAALGVGGVVTYDLTIAKNSIKTSSIGLAIMSAGTLIVIVAIAKIDKVQVFGNEGHKLTLTLINDYFVEHAWIIYLFLTIDLILLFGSWL